MAYQVLTATTAASQSAGTDVTLILGIVPSGFAQGTWSPTRVSLTSPATLTGATATSVTFTFQTRRANSVVGSFAALTTATGTNLTAGIETLVPAVTTPVAILAGDQVECVLTHAGAGTAYSLVAARVELQ